MKDSVSLISELLFLFAIVISPTFAQDKVAHVRQQIENLSQISISELRKMQITCDQLIETYKAANNDERAAEICYWSFMITEEIENRTEEETYDEKYNRLIRGWHFNNKNPYINRELGVLLKNRDKNKAISYFRTAINNGDKLAIEYLVQIFLENNSQPDSVLKWLSIYLSKKPYDIDKWLIFTDYLLSHSSFESTIDSLKKGITLNPTSQTLRLKLAYLYKSKEKWSDVLRECNEIKPLSEEVNRLINEATANLSMQEKIKEGKLLLETKNQTNWERSRNIFERILENDPKNNDALVYSRQAKNKLYKYCFEKAKSNNKIKNWPEAYAHSIMSITYAESENDRNLAFDEFKIAAVGLNRKIEAENAYQAAEQALRSGELEKARNKYILAIELYDNEPPKEIENGLTKTDLSEFYQRGLDALEKKDYVSAKTYFEHVKKINPKYDNINSFCSQSDSLLSWHILTTQLKKYYEIEKGNQNWRSAYGLIRLLSSINPDNFEYKNEVGNIKTKIISHAIIRNNILFFFLICLIIIGLVHFIENSLELRKWHKKGNNQVTLTKNTMKSLDKTSAIMRIILAFILFLLTETAVIFIYKNNLCFITSILSCEKVLLIVALVSLLFAKIYLRKRRLCRLGIIGTMILWLPPRID